MNFLCQLPRPLIIAHRGDSIHAPENTMSAFYSALKHGADAIELDAKLTADKQIVVIHDQTIDRTTGVHGSVRHLPLSVLRELDAGQFFGNEFSGEHIPTLDEVFESLGKLTYINVELTNYSSLYDELPDLVIDLARKHGVEERVFFSSFSYLNIIRVRKLMPQAVVALLATKGIFGSLSRSYLGYLLSPEIIHPYFTDITPQFMQHAKITGRRVHSWTVNEPDEMRRLFNLHIDGIFTDNPWMARHILDNY